MCYRLICVSVGFSHDEQIRLPSSFCRAGLLACWQGQRCRTDGVLVLFFKNQPIICDFLNSQNMRVASLISGYKCNTANNKCSHDSCKSQSFPLVCKVILKQRASPPHRKTTETPLMWNMWHFSGYVLEIKTSFAFYTQVLQHVRQKWDKSRAWEEEAALGPNQRGEEKKGRAQKERGITFFKANMKPMFILVLSAMPLFDPRLTNRKRLYFSKMILTWRRKDVKLKLFFRVWA